MAVDPGNDRTLRAKYLDWASAQIADHFVRLSPEEIYRIAHEGSREFAHTTLERGEAAASRSNAGRSRLQPQRDPSGDPPSGDASSPADLSYGALVQRVTEVLIQEMDVPSFEEWAGEYRADPDKYERAMLGFWREWV